MLQFIIAGLVLGGIYAIASAGLVITYTASGILNFAFGAMAYFIARFYYFLHTQENWSILLSAIVAILIAAPAMGVFLYAVLFRLPAALVAADQGRGHRRPAGRHPFGGRADLRQHGHSRGPGSGSPAGAVYQFLGVPVTLDQIIVYICVVLTVVLGALVLRYTEVGLKVRAMVDSPAMTDLSGTNPDAISARGLGRRRLLRRVSTGVLAAPIIGLGLEQLHPSHRCVLRRRHRGEVAQPPRWRSAWAS